MKKNTFCLQSIKSIQPNKMIITQLNQTTMKKTITTLLMLFCISTVFSQYDYIQDVYSAKDMNIKGKIKKITETEGFTDESGNVNDDGEVEFIYEFDEGGNVIYYEFSLDQQQQQFGWDYKYLNGKISEIISSWEKYFLYYTTSTITIKSSKGAITQVQTLSNGRISEIINYENSKENHKYEYNTIGQITKSIYGEKTNLISTYEYNKQGNKKRLVEYDKNSKLEHITDYDYKYDNNKNWKECTEKRYKTGSDKDDRTYCKRTRIYEFY